MSLDFDDNLDDFFGGPVAPRVVVPPVKLASVELDWSEAEAEDALTPLEFREDCRKCSGQGRFVSWAGRVVGNCFTCKGVGYFMRKTSPEHRTKERANTMARKSRVEQGTLAVFAETHPAVATWIEAHRKGFAFAQSMHDAVIKWGTLTERQIAACERLVALDATRAAEQQARVAAAPSVATDRLMAAFDAAKASGLKRPKMRFEGFQASLAGAQSKNAGAVYLTKGETYLGKIAEGKFHASRECSSAQREGIVATMIDPLAAAIAYGRRTGSCSCCGRELTDPVSVERGIGPICADNFGL